MDKVFTALNAVLFLICLNSATNSFYAGNYGLAVSNGILALLNAYSLLSSVKAVDNG